MNALLRTHWLKSVSDILHHDFCPTINHWVYWLKNPMWTLLLAVVGSALCGIFVNPQVFVLTGLFLLLEVQDAVPVATPPFRNALFARWAAGAARTAGRAAAASEAGADNQVS